MKKFYKALSILASLSYMITACGTHTLPIQTEEQTAQKTASYEVVLGKSMTDKAVIDFIFNNNCSSTDQFQLCKDVGMALWANSAQIVETVYLYTGGTNGFKRYQGKLPFGLSFYDPMWRVQEKIRNSNADDSLQQSGRPDEENSPDHMHYWAFYKRLDITIIYTSADEDAYIYAILVGM
jgi:hypothetical protein